MCCWLNYHMRANEKFCQDKCTFSALLIYTKHKDEEVSLFDKLLRVGG